MVTEEFIRSLISSAKYIQDNIIWSEAKRNTQYQTFRVDVLTTEGNYFLLIGHKSTNRKDIASLALVYNRVFPLARIDKKYHKNPEKVDGLEFRGWHKHIYDVLWEDKVAIDVSHEFNDNMIPKEFIDQFKKENNMRYIKGKMYQELLYEL